MIKFIKTRNVKDPTRNYNEDAGIDVFIPEKDSFSPEELLDIDCYENEIHIEPHDSVLIPLGIKSKFDSDLALIAMNKSGIATKKNLIVGACVIDSSYQGEWHIHLINFSNTAQTISFGQKITQFVPIKINNEPHEVLNDISIDEFYTETSNRGGNGFGSTGI